MNKKNRKIAILLLILISGIILLFAFSQIPFGKDRMYVGKYYIENGLKNTGSQNLVTSVVVDFRGFDTLGEVTVLFLAATGVGALMFYYKKEKDKEKFAEEKDASFILKVSTPILFPLILIFGVYVFIHGHLTPGGGFQGGAIIASSFLLLYIVFPHLFHELEGFKILESLAGITFVGLGLLGLIFGGFFLKNFLGKGIVGTLFSAGIIPIIYVAIGLKVGAELTGILDDLRRRE